MSTEDPIVTVDHLREAKLCVSGTKKWFMHAGLDFREFCTSGLPASVFEATGDHLAIGLAKIARDEAKDERA